MANFAVNWSMTDRAGQHGKKQPADHLVEPKGGGRDPTFTASGRTEVTEASALPAHAEKKSKQHRKGFA
ncbi:MAG: hypothetical protein EPN73_13010 [Paraburkholderia sp.]|uniref:hypothetical protein n=1 Tax=Paraburkholderia sp. TaxID=1926495 RepID=UPI0012050268|nr:hypothetical protein [Paraburkholderia sp.]TAL95561.1 MAG: hypothetical protein EPN73_13010 [Paraburkholderia sp.]